MNIDNGFGAARRGNVRVVYFDCWAGASGDMILGALLGAGAGLEQLNAGLALLNLGLSVSVEPVRRGRFAALKATVVGTREGATASAAWRKSVCFWPGAGSPRA